MLGLAWLLLTSRLWQTDTAKELLGDVCPTLCLIDMILQIDVGAQTLQWCFLSKKKNKKIFDLSGYILGISGRLPTIVWMNLTFNGFLNLLGV